MHFIRRLGTQEYKETLVVDVGGWYKIDLGQGAWEYLINQSKY